MLTLRRTDSSDPVFVDLVRRLDAELAIIDGDDHAFYDQFNKVTNIRHVVVAFAESGAPAGCGAFKPYDASTVEIKRMYVPAENRGAGIASQVLAELEHWATESGFTRSLLETGIRQPDAIALYLKNGYVQIPNFGQYAGVESSVCFEKHL